MSRYLDQYIHGGTVQPEVSLAADLITRIGHRPGLSNLNNAAERFSLEQMFKTLLSKTSAEELRYLLWWVFESHDTFWRDRISEATFPDNFITASFSTLFKKFHEDRTFVHHAPKPLKDTGYLDRLESIDPNGDLI